jgi:hypothetical protein
MASSASGNVADDPDFNADWLPDELEILSLLQEDAADSSAEAFDRGADEVNGLPSEASIVGRDEDSAVEGEVFCDMAIGPRVQWLIRQFRNANCGHSLFEEMSDQLLTKLIHDYLVPQLRDEFGLPTVPVEDVIAYASLPRPRPTVEYKAATENHKDKRRPTGLTYRKKQLGDKEASIVQCKEN